MKFEEFREGIFLNEVSLGGSPPIKGTLGDSAQGISWLMLFSLSITKEHSTDFQKKNIYSGLSSFCQRCNQYLSICQILNHSNDEIISSRHLIVVSGNISSLSQSHFLMIQEDIWLYKLNILTPSRLIQKCVGVDWWTLATWVSGSHGDHHPILPFLHIHHKGSSPKNCFL